MQALSTVFTDFTGSTTITLIRSALGGSAILADILAKSNADQLYNWQGAINVNATPTPTHAVYQPVATKANLIFQTASGSEVVVVIPSPKLSIFLADGKTVDSSQITSLIAQCLLDLVDSAGNPVIAYVGGYLTSNRTTAPTGA